MTEFYLPFDDTCEQCGRACDCEVVDDNDPISILCSCGHEHEFGYEDP